MKTKHTPGPWRSHEVSGQFSITNDASSFSGQWTGCVAITPKRDFDTAKEQKEWFEKDKANARMIAAVPLLLVACEQFCAQCEIETCARCEGSGKDRNNRHSACPNCGGCGEIVRHQIWPDDLRKMRAAMALAVEGVKQ